MQNKLMMMMMMAPYLVVSRGGDQAPQAPVMAGNETAWKTPTMMRTATARYRLALTHAAPG